MRPYPRLTSSESPSVSAHSSVAEMSSGWQKVKAAKTNRGKTMDRIGHFNVSRTANSKAWPPSLDAVRLSVSRVTCIHIDVGGTTYI